MAGAARRLRRCRAVGPAPIDGVAGHRLFGHVNPAKRIPQLLRAFARLARAASRRAARPRGRDRPGFELDRRIEGLGLEDAVVSEGYVDDQRLWSLMAACDVDRHLRAPTMGETSAAALQALALGKPLVVSDLGWFAELPREVAVNPGRRAGARGPGGGAGGADRRRGSAPDDGAAAVELHPRASTTSSASPSCTSPRSSGRREATLSRMRSGREVAQAAAEVEIGADSPELAEIARELRESDIV